MPYYIERRPSGIYRLRGTHHGVPAQDRSLKTRSAEQAEALREAAEREVFERVVYGKRPAQTFAALSIDFLTAGRDLGPRSVDIIEHLADKRLDDITPADCDRLAAKIYPDAKPSTVNRNIIAPISAIMNWAAADGRAPLRKWPRRRERQTMTDWRRPAEIEQIMSHLTSPQARALFAIYVGCGLRASEAVFLDGREIAPDISRVRVLGTVRPTDKGAIEKGYQGTKGHYDRVVPIPERARQIIAPVVNLGPGRAFVNSRGFAWSDRNALVKTLKAACVRAKVPELTPHTLRHTFATWHYAVHRDRLGLMTLGGWTDDDLIKRYVHLADEALREEVLQSKWAISGQSVPAAEEKDIENNTKAG